MPRLITEWSTDDPQLAEMLTWIERTPPHTEERLELEAMLHLFLARVSYVELGELRATRRNRQRRTSNVEGSVREQRR